MKKYFMGIKWLDAFHPVIHLKDYSSHSEEDVLIPDSWETVKLKSKICSGAVNPLTREHFSCNKLIEENQTQCYSCMHKFDFYNCVRCHGDDCMSKDNDVISYCNTPHYVYLVYFSRDKIKVGTASEVRKYDRLLEQGAIFSVFIAKTPTGKIARQIEKNIIDSGISGTVTTSFKMKNLVFTESTEEIREQLLKTYQIVSKYIDEENSMYLIEPEFNHFENIQKSIENCMQSQSGQIDMFGSQLHGTRDYEISKESDCMVGRFLFAVGKIVAFENNGVVQLHDSKKWEGYLFDFKNVNVFEPYG